MTIKERPLINAVSKLGPIPTPSHPILSGIYTTAIAGLFGAVAFFFQAYGRGAVATAADFYSAVMVGSWIGFAVVAVCYVALLLASRQEEAETTVPFVVAGLLSIVAFVACEVLLPAAFIVMMER
ncbi:MAG: hypothetical protein AAGI89_10960 [Pseudomonadota bacterium]